MRARGAAILDRLNAAPLNWVLLGIALLAALPRLYLAATQFIEYDGYWHVFIAMQDNWQQFQWEYQSNFHPPLFYLLLKVALLFGHNRMVYRAISLLTGVAAVFVIGKIAGRVSLRRETAVVAALTYGLALPAIIISCEVRSYMLSVFFVLVSFYYFLDIVGPEGGASGKSRVLFALSAILAGYSHYGAFSYVFACTACAAAFDLFPPRQNLAKRLALDFAAFGAIGAALSYVYFTHARAHAHAAEHLYSYYFQPGTGESVGVFLLRNTRALFNRFSPVAIGSLAQFRVVLAALILCAGSLAYLIRNLRRPENARAAATVLTSGVILTAIMAGAVMDVYPYGGELRQQFFLFPFAILCGCILLDRLATAIGRPRLASAVVVLAVAAILAGWTIAFAQWPKVKTELGTAQMIRFHETFPAPGGVYVDEFNLINFFIHYHNWDWRFVGHNSAVPTVDVYRVSRGTKSLLVLRDRQRWNLDLGDRSVYRDLAKCIRSQPLPSLTVFYTQQKPPASTKPPELSPPNQIAALAASESLCVKKLIIEGVAVYGEFRTDGCAAEVDTQTRCRDCDDTSWTIAYSGDWSRGDFDKAWNSTLTYSADPGATARFAFDGTELRYVYSKAFNRGLAAITIDGVAKGVLDLYSPTIEWQSTTTFGGLPPGHHTIEIRVTGRHNPASEGAYIDIDALLAP
jgi:4-amino-4-deoxy-L-arabinose transferase-like glycosyltransferase